MKGLYYYKLESPYPEDVTKNCKLTVNEIDSNFVTLKDMDIKSARVSEGDNTIILERNNGDDITVDMNPLIGNSAKDLNFNYDSTNGTITIVYNNNTLVIDGLVTKDNVDGTILTSVHSNSTLVGDGTTKSPLSISPIEQTSMFKGVERLYDLTSSVNPCLPHPANLKKGDRFITYENVSDYGYLYDFRAVKRIQEDLRNGWRIPTKQDWDGMLNAIEPCDEFRNHDSIMGNQVLGKFAGKLLKTKDKWDKVTPCPPYHDCECHNDENHVCTCNSEETFDLDYSDCLKEDKDIKSCCPQPTPKPISPDGIDAYGFGAVPSGYGDGCQLMDYFGKRGVYWTSSMSHVTDVYVKRFDYNKTGVIQLIESPQSLFSLRLVKDYDGSNHKDVETINGMSYPTVLMPSKTAPSGFAIWTAINVAFKNERYRPCEPNQGFDVTYQPKYFINEWTGFDFIRKEMNEGDSVVIFNNPDGRYSVKYRIVNGVLVDESKMIFNDVIVSITPKLEEIVNKISSLEIRVDKAEDNIESHSNSITNLENNLAKEISDRQYADSVLNEKLNDEIEERKKADDELKESIEEEASNREQADVQIWSAISAETEKRISGDEELKQLINSETQTREEEIEKLKQTDSELLTMINNIDVVHNEQIEKLQNIVNTEIEERKAEDEAIRKIIDTEIADRKEADKELQANLDEEKQERVANDRVLAEKIRVESENRENEDKKLWDAIGNHDTEVDETINELTERLNKEIQDRIDGDEVLAESISAEESERKSQDEVLHNEIVAETERAIESEKRIQSNLDAVDKKLDDEINRATSAELEITKKLISTDGSYYDCENGILYLKQEGENMGITIKLTSNYGTF